MWLVVDICIISPLIYTLYDTLNPGNKYGGSQLMNILHSCCTAVRLQTEVGPINCHNSELGNANISTEKNVKVVVKCLK